MNHRMAMASCVAATVFASMLASGSAIAGSATVIRNYSTGLCAYPATNAVGATIQQAACDASAPQLWEVEYVDKGGYSTTGNIYIRLKNAQSGLCMDLQSASTASGIKLVQKTCSYATTQQWSPPSTAYTSYLNRYSAKCMDAPPDTTPIQQYTCGSVDNQRWFIGG